MSSKLAIIALNLALLILPSVALAAWDLVTPEEDARDRAAPHLPGPADLPAPPGIELLRPDISTPIRNPVTIELRFTPGSGPPVDIQTFRATYGWLGINITNRLLEHARTTPDGLWPRTLTCRLAITELHCPSPTRLARVRHERSGSRLLRPNAVSSRSRLR